MNIAKDKYIQYQSDSDTKYGLFILNDSTLFVLKQWKVFTLREVND